MFELSREKFDELAYELSGKAYALDYIRHELGEDQIPPELEDEYNRLLEIYGNCRIVGGDKFINSKDIITGDNDAN